MWGIVTRTFCINQFEFNFWNMYKREKKYYYLLKKKKIEQQRAKTQQKKTVRKKKYLKLKIHFV